MTTQKAVLSTDKHSNLKWVVRSETPTANKYFPARAWISINRDGIIAESVESVGVAAATAELREYAIAQSKKMPRGADLAKAQINSATSSPAYTRSRRTVCLNCDGGGLITSRGYCTDCDGEC
jgi:hypothetical protein